MHDVLQQAMRQLCESRLQIIVAVPSDMLVAVGQDCRAGQQIAQHVCQNNCIVLQSPLHVAYNGRKMHDL